MNAKEFRNLNLGDRIAAIEAALAKGTFEELYLSSTTAAELDAVEDAVQGRKVLLAKAAIRARRQEILDAGLPATWGDADPAPRSDARARAHEAFERAKAAHKRAMACLQNRSD